MATTIHTFGTQGRSLDELQVEAEHYDAVVIDVRFSPRSRNPEWNRPVMSALLGGRYVHLKGFGNRNYKSGGEIVLHDPDGAAEKVRQLFDEGRDLILLCYEASPKGCHRTDVALHLHEIHGSPIHHLQPGGGGVDHQEIFPDFSQNDLFS